MGFWAAFSLLLCLGPVASAGTQTPDPRTASASPAGRVDVEFQDTDIHQVFRVFADLGDVNIVPERGIRGKVTARIENVFWRDALETIVCSMGLEMVIDGNVIYVQRPPSRR